MPSGLEKTKTVRAVLAALLALTALIVGCSVVSESRHQVETSAEDVPVEKISIDKLFAESPKFRLNYERYQPAVEVIEELKKVRRKITAVLFIGTWNEDSIKEGPKFLKVLKQVENPCFTLAIYSVNRNMKDGQGVVSKLDIRKLPTIIVIEDGWELGRIADYSKAPVEVEFLRLISSRL